MEEDTLVESVKFLLKSVRELSDRVVESNQGISKTFGNVWKDINEIQETLAKIENELGDAVDQQLLSAESQRRSIELPVKEEHKDLLIPALNLPLEGLLDAYQNSPALLQPFARPCSVSGRTLGGEISEVELEVFAQGTSWMIETQDGDWILVPRPGMLQRRALVEGLRRLFEIAVEGALPAEVELLKAATATVIEHGRRWYLKEKGEIGIQTDPLKRSLEQRLCMLEQKVNTVN